MISCVVKPEREADPVEESGEFTTALDSIDASMKTDASIKAVNRQEVTITSEALAKIVSDAVADAIAAYERARGLAPEPAPVSSSRTNLARLQSDMGLDEIAFDEAGGAIDLAADMGVDGFVFDDAPPHAAEPAISTDVPIDAKTAAALSAWDEALKGLVPEPHATAVSAPLHSEAPLKPEDPAATIFFTFDPMPPVPPPLPREPRKD